MQYTVLTSGILNIPTNHGDLPILTVWFDEQFNQNDPDISFGVTPRENLKVGIIATNGVNPFPDNWGGIDITTYTVSTAIFYAWSYDTYRNSASITGQFAYSSPILLIDAVGNAVASPTLRLGYSEKSYNNHKLSDATTTEYGLATIFQAGLVLQLDNVRSWNEALLIGGLLKNASKIPSNDPFKPGGETDTGGGKGDFDGTTVPIEKPTLPTLSAVSAGFVSMYNPSLSQINALASFMWSDAFSLDTFKKLFGDPMDAILGLNIIPVQPSIGDSTTVKIGNVDTAISMPPITSQYVERDCGTLDVKEYWGAYLDYEPFTRAELYLPYIGTRQISVDDIMGKSVQVVYHIDILSGACVAYVICSGTVLYSFSGQCAATIPMTGQDWTNVVNGVLSIAASVVGLATGGGAMAAGVLGGVASTAVNQMKPDIQKSGSLSGVGGLLGVQTPYLILTRPRQAVPAYQNTFRGYPSFITVKLGDLSGYTEIESIHLENVPATNEELQEIDALLRGGVIF